MRSPPPQWKLLEAPLSSPATVQREHSAARGRYDGGVERSGDFFVAVFFDTERSRAAAFFAAAGAEVFDPVLLTAVLPAALLSAASSRLPTRCQSRLLPLEVVDNLLKVSQVPSLVLVV